MSVNQRIFALPAQHLKALANTQNKYIPHLTTLSSTCRAIVFSSQIQAALAAGAAAIMTWEVLPMTIDPGQTFDFTWNSDGGQVIQALTAYASCQASGSVT